MNCNDYNLKDCFMCTSESARELARVMMNEFADIVADKLTDKVAQMIRTNKPTTYNQLEVCKMLSVTQQTLNKYVEQGKLHPLNCGVRGRGRLFDAHEIEAAIRGGEVRKFARQ